MRTTSHFIDILLSLKVDKSFFIDILHWYDIYKSIINLPARINVVIIRCLAILQFQSIL